MARAINTQAEAQRFIAAFGAADGVKFFGEGLTFEQATARAEAKARREAAAKGESGSPLERTLRKLAGSK